MSIQNENAYLQAYTEMATIFFKAWTDPESQGGSGYPLDTIKWENLPTDIAVFVTTLGGEATKLLETVGELDPVTARFSLRHFTGEAGFLLSHPDEGVGGRRYARTGLIIIQLFVPKCYIGPNDEGVLARSYQLGTLVSRAYEQGQTPGGIWFRNVRINEAGEEGTFVQTNVLTEFEYDEIRYHRAQGG